MIRKKHVLFVSHDASLTGAPISLLQIITSLKEIFKIEAYILLLQDGPLSADFSKVGEVIHVPKKVYGVKWYSRIYRRVFNMEHKEHTLFYQKLASNAFDLVYVNTSACSQIIPNLKKTLNVPVILHVHELSMIIKLFCGEEAFKKSIPYCDQFIAVSDLVKDMLSNNYSIPLTKITKVWEPARSLKGSTAVDVQLSPEIKDFLADADFVVTGCGTLDWRKAPQWFLEVAMLTKRKRTKKIKFLWIGGNLASFEYKIIENDIHQLQLEDTILFTGQTTESMNIFSHGDVFFLSSREDPFPLVSIENAVLGKPILCFKGVTGINEFVNQENGFSADYFDLNAISDEIIKMSENKEYYQTKSNNIKALSSKFSIDKIIKPIVDVVKSYLEN